MEDNLCREVPAIKVCGLTLVYEADLLKRYQVDYAGMILFVPKSKRNITIDKAREIIKALGNIKKVLVTVSPTLEQIKEMDALKADYIQIHGTLDQNVYQSIQTPILRAFNISDLEEFERVKNLDKIAGFVFDGANAGSGKTFDWNLVKHFDCGNKLYFLAGGLHDKNVEEAIRFLHPDVVDVSSGVEGENGKDKEKIAAFVAAVRKA